MLKLGKVYVTKLVKEKMEEDKDFVTFIFCSLLRHLLGDWGDLSQEDRKENELSLREGLRIFSAYRYKDGTKIWVITEADRSATTVLFPEEY